MENTFHRLWQLCFIVVLPVLLLLSGVALPAATAPPGHIAQPHISSRLRLEPPSGAPLTPREQARGHQRAREGRLLFLTFLLFNGALLAGFLLLGGTRLLARLVGGFGANWIPAVAIVYVLCAVAWTLLNFPLDYYGGFVFAHQYGLSNQTVGQWLPEFLRSTGINLLVGLALVLLLYLLLRKSPRHWWLWLGVASAPVSIFFILIQPVFIEPLSNKFTPLPDTPLRRDILALAHRQGINAKDVYLVDASRQTRAVNAYVNGFGPTQRIVLYDTLLHELTPDEIKFIMAHEMGHYVLGHIRRGICYAVLGAFLAGFLLFRVSDLLLRRYGQKLGISALGDPAGFPLLVALGMALWIISLPIANTLSREIESEADHFAVQVYPHPEAGIHAFHQIARLNVAEEDTPRWAEILLGTHPSLARRIDRLKREE